MGLVGHYLSSDWTGRGGASIYGKQFEDELHPDLKFTGKYVIWLDGQERECIVNACFFGCGSRYVLDTMAWRQTAAQPRRHRVPWQMKENSASRESLAIPSAGLCSGLYPLVKCCKVKALKHPHREARPWGS